MTALQRARQDVQNASNRMQFLAMMSHEIRTPMYAVVALADVLLVSGGLSADQAFMVETLKRSGDHLVSITNDILDYSKYESGRLMLERRPLSLRKCVEDALDLISFNQRLNAPVITAQTNLNYFIAPDVPEVILGDVTRLLQLFNNLLSNAAKFTSQVSGPTRTTGQPCPSVRRHAIPRPHRRMAQATAGRERWDGVWDLCRVISSSRCSGLRPTRVPRTVCGRWHPANPMRCLARLGPTSCDCRWW